MEPEKLDLASAGSPTNRRRNSKHCPESRDRGRKIDFDRLKATLGEAVDPGKERYGLKTGRARPTCFKTIQMPSMATLVLARDESVNFDLTENVIIDRRQPGGLEAPAKVLPWGR